MSPQRPGAPLQPEGAVHEIPEFFAAVKSVRVDLENGDRFLTLRIDKKDAATIAALSLYDGIVFKTKMKAHEVPKEPGSENPL